MVLTITPQAASDHALYSLIDEYAHAYLPIRKMPAETYLEEEELSLMANVSRERLQELAVLDNRINCVKLPTGCTYYHPDSAALLISKHFRKMTKRIKFSN
jgi:hypothetical protein